MSKLGSSTSTAVPANGASLFDVEQAWVSEGEDDLQSACHNGLLEPKAPAHPRMRVQWRHSQRKCLRDSAGSAIEDMATREQEVTVPTCPKHKQYVRPQHRSTPVDSGFTEGSTATNCSSSFEKVAMATSAEVDNARSKVVRLPMIQGAEKSADFDDERDGRRRLQLPSSFVDVDPSVLNMDLPISDVLQECAAPCSASSSRFLSPWLRK